MRFQTPLLRAPLRYLVQRDDCSRTRVAAVIDPAYPAALAKARAAGVEVLAHRAHLAVDAITPGRPLPAR